MLITVSPIFYKEEKLDLAVFYYPELSKNLMTYGNGELFVSKVGICLVEILQLDCKHQPRDSQGQKYIFPQGLFGNVGE